MECLNYKLNSFNRHRAIQAIYFFLFSRFYSLHCFCYISLHKVVYNIPDYLLDIHGISSNIIYLISDMSTLFLLSFFLATLARNLFFLFLKFLQRTIFQFHIFSVLKLFPILLIYCSGVYYFLSLASIRCHLCFVFYTLKVEVVIINLRQFFSNNTSI